MTTPLICTQCGNIDTPKIGVKGNLLIEIILWCTLILPGVIYSIWRRSGRNNICTKCRSNQIIPLDSPRAKKILEETGGSQEAYLEEVRTKEVAKQEKIKKESKVMWTILIVVIVMFLFSIIGMAGL